MKKFKSKFFCIATEGATTDGRNISPEWIRQMAETFNRKTYGARIWLEHIRGLMPDGAFKAYGDVVALEARKKEDGKLGLYAQIEPTEELIKLNKQRQKIYTSIEIEENFANTGKAYLVGLAITDSPASLGTDVLTFSKKNPENSFLAARKLNKNNLFSEAQEVEIEFVEVEDKPSISERIKTAFQPFRRQAEKIEGEVEGILDAVEDVAKYSAGVSDRVDAITENLKEYTNLQKQFADLKAEFSTFKTQIENTDASTDARPDATGSDGILLTDC